MKRPFSAAAAIVAWTLMCVVVSSASIWEKPFTAWSDGELKDILATSPWTGKANISYTHARGGSSPAIDETVHVTWTSALPMRQARVRQEIGAGGTVPKELESYLAQPLNAYIVSVKVSGGPGSSSYTRLITTIQKETFLTREGKEPLSPLQAEGTVLDKDGKVIETPPGGGGPGGPGGGGAPRGGQPPNGPAFSVLRAPEEGQGQRGGGGFGAGGGRGVQGGSSVLVFAFPKTDPITVADKEVEFETKIGQYTVKKKFKLKDMVLAGELAL